MAAFDGHNGQDRASTRTSRKRRPVSCFPCQNRKLKCDRTLPACGNCLHRGDIAACDYASRKTGPASQAQRTTDLTNDAQAQIDRLEKIVLALLKNSPTAPSHLATPSASVDTDADRDASVEEVAATSHAYDHSGDADLQALKTPDLRFDAKERHSVNEAQFSLLLNEVESQSSGSRNLD
ncbi:hypothetical protein LTR56_015853 [Elasticomyces elasticus]|nr:hypothetical protein LTR56_015853 [Elasticomyces elasticus]KAK3640015.1 hypothetical protein LTR22_017173 [Elasticomyces elasticus]KAK4908205.1 hypothetical protein LTR49_022850 [Elasticomyces elasticus]KAK5754970.1 hypothetical protein LTS12_014886 [Elasticomyces elasticus]